MMLISKIIVPLDGVLGDIWRGRHEADGVVVWLATVHCSQNDNDVKAATRRARSKAGDDTWRSRRSATREDGIKRKIFGMIRVEAQSIQQRRATLAQHSVDKVAELLASMPSKLIYINVQWRERERISGNGYGRMD
uniref:Uncharacterized protein n=1 Tax=Oryza barthii TaxID=65489 RepID=A0A0D3GY77_9ORYZ